jgi:hypothetical protein
MVLGAEEGVVAERLAELALAHDLAVKLGHAARQVRMMVIDGKERVAHGRCHEPSSWAESIMIYVIAYDMHNKSQGSVK